MQLIHEIKNVNGTLYELFDGINGSGETTYLVASVEVSGGRWIHTDEFVSLGEAKNWMKWS